jgi:hypothetical protein
MVDTLKDIKQYKQEWFDKVEKNSLDLFDIAEEAIKNNPHLQVVIVKRLPRYDRGSADLLKIKSKLSEFGNSVYNQVWIKRGCPSNIRIVEIEFGCSDGPDRAYLRKIIYGDQKQKF